MSENLTFGLEIELADVDRRAVALPDGCAWNGIERDIVNSDGRAVDPTGATHTIGGEINTLPTDTVNGQIELVRNCLQRIERAGQKPSINHRTWLHVHVGFADETRRTSVKFLQRLQRYIQAEQQMVLLICGLTRRPAGMDAKAFGWWQEIAFPGYKYDYCRKAKTLKEFRSAFFANKAGIHAPQTFRRAAINLYSIFKHGTVEFRIFGGTLDAQEVFGALHFAEDFIKQAIADEPQSVLKWYSRSKYLLPKVSIFRRDLEIGWRKTCVKK